MKKMMVMQKKQAEPKAKATKEGEVCCPECGHEFSPKMEYEEDEED
jgi:transposase